MHIYVNYITLLKYLHNIYIKTCYSVCLLFTIVTSLPTVHYGTRSVESSNHEDDKMNQLNNPSVSVSDTCPNNTVQCDGISDCELGSDETKCGKCTHTAPVLLRIITI